MIDPGYSSVRAGFAGEDAPKSFVNSHYGVSSDRLLFGDDSIHNPLANLDIRNPMSKDGIVEDWDVATQLWEYAITSRLTSFKQMDPRKNGLNRLEKNADPEKNVEPLTEKEIEMLGVGENEKPLEEHPLLMSEPAWNTGKARERCIEIAMESWGCPAFWLARNTVLAAFAAGKATALVVDVGASNASVAAVHDGLILKKSVQRSPLAGNWISSQVRAMLKAQEPKVNLVPHYMIASKTPVDAGAPAQATYRTHKNPPSDSFRVLEEERVLTEFKESVVEVWKGHGKLLAQSSNGQSNYEIANGLPIRVFEMPDGSNQKWGAERFQVVEGLYDEKAAFPIDNDPQVTRAQTILGMVTAAIMGVDMDLRPALLSNIVITGGSTLINGFVDRLNQELIQMYPGMRIKIQAAGLMQERRFGSWIGGSILGSLGTFHQMWVSRKEYEELGAGVVEKRCK